MRSLISILGVLLVGLILLACGEGKSDPTEAGLRQRAEAAAEAASSANQKDHPWDIWKDVHRFTTPEYRDRCGPGDEFGLQVHSNLQRLAGEAVLGGGVELSGAVVGRDSGARLQLIFAGNRFDGSVLSKFVTQLEYRVADVTIDGAKGQVELQVLYQGEPVTLSGDREPEYWVYDEGQWFLESSGYWMDEEERLGEGCLYGRAGIFFPQ